MFIIAIFILEIEFLNDRKQPATNDKVGCTNTFISRIPKTITIEYLLKI